MFIPLSVPGDISGSCWGMSLCVHLHTPNDSHSKRRLPSWVLNRYPPLPTDAEAPAHGVVVILRGALKEVVRVK